MKKFSESENIESLITDAFLELEDEFEIISKINMSNQYIHTVHILWDDLEIDNMVKLVKNMKSAILRCKCDSHNISSKSANGFLVRLNYNKQ